MRLVAMGLALTAYIVNSVITTTLFYGYGLGMINRLGPAHLLPIAIVIFGLEILFCNWWIKHFRFGPLEWLWRSQTYWKIQPMKIA